MACQTHIPPPRILIGLLALCSFAFFQLLLPYHLFFKEQMQLFLLTEEHFLSFRDKPAWLACYAGDFLTQFFYLRAGGAATLTLTLLAEYLLAAQALRQTGCRRYAAGLALLPVAADGFLHCGLYYGLPASLSLILALAAFLAFTTLFRHPHSPAHKAHSGAGLPALLAGVLLLPCLYALAGAAFFLFPALVTAYLWRKGKKHRLYGLMLMALAGAYPAAVAPHYLQTAGQAYRYPFPATLNLRGVDPERETILSLAVEAGRGNWNEVERRAEKAGFSNPLVTYYANIASSRRGQLAENLLNRYQPFTNGLFLPVNPQSGWLTIFLSNEVFYHLGDMIMAQHSAMLGMIFSPRRRSVQMTRRLAEISLAGGDTALARKYLRMLNATLFHRRWAEKREAQPPRHRHITSKDTLRTASSHAVALELLIESAPEERRATDYLLCYHLLNKNIPAFVRAFNRHRRAYRHLPRLYGEALLIHLAAQQAPPQTLQTCGIPDALTADFIDYTRIYQQNSGNPEPLRQRFGRGYWFYYHFARPGKEEAGE